MASWGVLAGVLLLLGWYVFQCIKLRSRVGGELADLADDFEADIEARAERGQDPDWIRYGEEGDRRHEFDSERMRNLSTAALATGVGGTMLMLLLHFLYGDMGAVPGDTGDVSGDTGGVSGDVGGAPDGARELNALFDAMGFALSASGLGVIANLIILLGILKSANARFDKARVAFMDELRKTSKTNPPITLTTTLTTTLAGRLDELLQASVQNFPGVIRNFNKSVGALNSGVGALTAVVDRFHDDAISMSSAVSSLSGSVSQLESLPANLRDEMTSAQETWAATARTAQKRHLDELSAVIDRHNTEARDLLDAFADRQERMRSITTALTTSVAGLDSFPARLREELANATQDWASAAAQVHERHLDELRDAVAAHADHVRRTLDVIGDWKSEMAVLEERWHAQRDEERRERKEERDEERKTWEKYRDEERKTWREHRATEREAHERVVRALTDGTSDIAAAAHGLPAAFTEKLQEGADRLGRAFGSQASNVVADLVLELGIQNEALGEAWERHVNKMLNQMGDLREEFGKQNRALGDAWGRHVDKMLGQMADMVREGLKPTVGGIAGIGANLEALGERLEGLGQEVRGAVGEFAKQGEGFSGSMEDAAATFRESSSQLLKVHEAARESIDHVRRQHEEMQARMEKALAEVAEQLRAMSKPGLAIRLYAELKRRVRSLLGRGDGKAKEGSE